MSDFSELEKILQIQFNNRELLKEALTHRSFLNENKDSKANNNERLEFLGDAVLELVTTELLFKKYPEHPEGTLTSFRAALVKTESLAAESLRLGIGKFIFMSGGEENTGGRTRPYILANTFESLIGAIYLEYGYLKASEFIKKELFYKIDNIAENRLDIDSKSKLQELAQTEFKITPTYQLVKEKGPDHNKIFTMAAMLGEIVISKGEGISKQNAEQNAASDALDNWEKVKITFSGKEK